MISVFDHPFLSALFNDPEIAHLWHAKAQLDHYITFEAALAEALGSAGLVSHEAGSATAAAIRKTEITLEALNAGTSEDGVPIPALVRVLKAGSPHPEAVHSGATSQDVMDTALALTLRGITDRLLARLEALRAALDAVAERFDRNTLMGRTRMQAALPIQVSDRVSSWRAPLDGHYARLTALRPVTELLQLGGPVGTREGWGAKADTVARSMADALSLNTPAHVWHSDRANLADYANALSLITGSLGKMGQDISLMAQQGIDEIRLSGGGTSSAMPHKSNPVAAELLVTLARFNATQLAGMHQAMVHEQERSGAAWMLEWMTLPAMTIATGRALSASTEIAGRIESFGTAADD